MSAFNPQKKQRRKMIGHDRMVKFDEGIKEIREKLPEVKVKLERLKKNV